MDVARLKESWALVAEHGDQVPLFFYSTLFLTHPDTRQLFPTNMAGQRDRLVTALGHIVSEVDKVDHLVGFLKELGADHRKFGTQPEHYPAVGEALLATLAHFLGDRWTEELEADWTAAYGLVSKVMIEAADEANQSSPPWWAAEILAHERRSFDAAVLTLRPQYLLPFTPGQSIGVCTPAVRAWRYYSPANAPRTDGTLELHVRAAPGGAVSSRLVYSAKVGDQLYLASPVGDRLLLDHAGSSDLLLLASGTGWAPLKSLVDQVAVEGGLRRRVSLFVAARSRTEFYDSEGIDKLAASAAWLDVHYVVSSEEQQGEYPPVVQRALAAGDWRSRHIYVCGADSMVSGCLTALQQAGYHPAQLHFEGLGEHWYGASWRTAVHGPAGEAYGGGQ